ncbi:hypothetical protein Tco_1215736 [Tanacetum coccineum]
MMAGGEIIMENVIPPNHVDDLLIVEPNQPDDVPVIPEPVLVDDDEDPEEEKFKEEEEPQEEDIKCQTTADKVDSSAKAIGMLVWLTTERSGTSIKRAKDYKQSSGNACTCDDADIQTHYMMKISMVMVLTTAPP